MSNTRPGTSGFVTRRARQLARASRFAARPLNRVGILLVVVLLGGCGDDGGTPTVGAPESSLAGVYSGTFPCYDCPGIATTLWLRPDGRYFFQQEYPGDDGRAASATYSLGRWSRGGDDRTVELRGPGPRRRFTRPDAETLLLQTDSNLEHRLTRDPAMPAFAATIRMTGTVRLSGGTAFFTECRTGLAAPISEGRKLSRLMHQYRSTRPRGRPAFVEFEGRFSWSADGSAKSVIIERFVTVKPDGTC